MFQSVIVKNTFASIASVVVVVESPPPPPSRRLRALSRPRRRCRPCNYSSCLDCWSSKYLKCSSSKRALALEKPSFCS